MPTSDALIVVEDWISEHFFTTDARKESFQKLVLDRRKQWDSEDIETPRSKFTKQASKLATTLAALYSDDLDEASRAGATTQAHEKLLDVLGDLTGEFKTDPHGPVRFFSTAGVDEPALIIGPEPADAAFAALRLCDQVRRRRRVSGSVFGTICGSRPSALRTTAPSPVPP